MTTPAPRIFTVDELREIDRLAADEFAMPTLLLMEHAAIGLANAAEHELETLGHRSVLIATGAGNNAGDGFAAARMLFDRGITVTIAECVRSDSLRGDALANHRMASARRMPIIDVTAPDASLENVIHHQGPSLIIDALLGTGLSRPVEGDLLDAIRAINASTATVISADVPSGLHADTGAAMPEAVRADLTVTFAGLKQGFARAEGPAHAGRVVIAPIGAPPELLQRFGTTIANPS